MNILSLKNRNHTQNVNEQAEKVLRDYIESIVPVARRFFQTIKRYAHPVSPIAEDMVTRFEQFIGGKRLRGALTAHAYAMMGGKPTDDILTASLGIELIHAFALMHDDIMDQDTLRRGKPTVHVQYESWMRQHYPSSVRDPKQYGMSMAINVGDFGSHVLNLLIATTRFSADRKIAFLKRISKISVYMIFGQGLDVTRELEAVPREPHVMNIHTYKTAYYTIVGPLQYGMALAGVGERDPRYRAAEKFGVPIGIAFQLRDDELGMFSDSHTLGKSVTSDLRQGKNTLLFAKAFAGADTKQRKFLESVHGNPKVTEADVQKTNRILEETGALAYSQKLSRALVEKGKKFIPAVTSDPEYQKLLALMADYVITRES